MKKLFIGVMCAVMLLSLSCFTLNSDKKVAAETTDNKLVYKLDFEDNENLGKNSASTEIADATVYKTDNSHMYTVDRKGGKALFINAQDTKFQNYLNLPTSVFDGQTEATISGWFYHPTGAGAYLGQIGAFSQENDKAFRADPYGPDFGGHYIYCFGNNQVLGDTEIFPVYDAWYHMAYVINGNEVKIYQNGHLAETWQANWETVSALYSENSHFYLGQSAWEDSHPDYYGGFDDIRVYQKALTEQELADEYGFDAFSFMTDEYTFDNEENLYKDNVRNYNATAMPQETAIGVTTQPQYVDGAMYLDGNSAALMARSENGKLNSTYFLGMSEATFSLDFKFEEGNKYQWVRLFDIFVGGQTMSFMACQGGKGSSFDIVYNNNASDAWSVDWVLGSSGKTFAFEEGMWYNTVVTVTKEKLTVYVDGEEIASLTINLPLYKSTNHFEDKNNSWFTLGGPVYENDRRITASYDNVRVFADALTGEQVKTIMNGYTRSLLEATITLVDGETKQEIKYNNKENYTLTQPTKDGYIFRGWQDEAGNVYTVVKAGTGNITLTAVWDEFSYTLKFNANGGRGEMQDFSATSQDATIPECGFAKTGYKFMGWATTAEGEVKYADKEPAASFGEDLTLYAVWAAKTYTVTFDANGGDGEMQGLQMTYDVETILTPNAFTKNGYLFDGWALTKGGIAVYSDGQNVTGISEGNDVVLYAHWVLKCYTITFDANGGEGSMENMKADALSLISITENTFTKAGYKFIGWATTQNGEKVYDDCQVAEFTDDITLYACWEEDATSSDSSSDSTTDSTSDSSIDSTVNPSEKKGCFSDVKSQSGTLVLLGLAVSVLFVIKSKNQKRA